MIKRFILNLLQGIGHIRMFPDNRSVDEILQEYHGNNNSEMLYMLLGFVLIVAGISVGTCMILMSEHDVAGTILVVSACGVWIYGQIRRIRK